MDSADERLEAEAELERRIKFIATMMKDELEKRDLWQYMWPEDAEYVEDRIHANYEFRW